MKTPPEQTRPRRCIPSRPYAMGKYDLLRLGESLALTQASSATERGIKQRHVFAAHWRVDKRSILHFSIMLTSCRIALPVFESWSLGRRRSFSGAGCRLVKATHGSHPWNLDGKSESYHHPWGDSRSVLLRDSCPLHLMVDPRGPNRTRFPTVSTPVLMNEPRSMLPSSLPRPPQRQFYSTVQHSTR